MPIEDRGHSVVATACPYCNKPLGEQKSLAKHLVRECPVYGEDDTADGSEGESA